MENTTQGILQEIKDTKQKINILQADLSIFIKKHFAGLANVELFDKFEKLKSVRWTQYTPYFNDGEECTFSAHIDDFTVNGESYESWLTEDGEEDTTITQDEKDKIEVAISDFLQIFDKKDYRDMFGDHAEVFLTKEGVSVNRYSHD